MSKPTKAQLRVIEVLMRLARMCGEEENYAKYLSPALEIMLNDLKADDFFGTEGQCDPRGDFRDAGWAMNFVQGIDTD